MSYNGSGTFVINTAGQPVVSGSTITSTAFNLLTADLGTGLSTALTKDGQTTPTGNIKMGAYKIVNLAKGTVSTDAVNYGQLQSSVTQLLTVTGTDTYAGTASPTYTAYVAGDLFNFVVPNTNTGAATLNIDTLGAKAITRTGAVALVAGDLIATQIAQVVYDGTRFQLLNGNSFTNLGVSGNLAFSGTANRITGDFSNATVANRVSFKTSTIDNNTVVSVIPNGTATTTNVIAYNNSDPTNAAFASIGAIGATDTRIQSGITGTGTYLPLSIYTSGASQFGIATTGIITVPNTINYTNTAVTVAANAGTVPVTKRTNTFTNSSAATMTITMATASAVDGQLTLVRIYDFSAVAQTITWVNTENSGVSVPTTSNGSTTLPKTVGFMYNNATSKWRCIASV